jgi:F-type H+-transporting ATPase subunit b
MPQIAQLAEVWSSQLFWMLLTFGFVFFVIGLGMVPKVQSTVDLRDKKIADDLAAAKATFAGADALEEQWRIKENAARADAQAVMAAAKAEAAKERDAALATADASIEADVAKAEASIAKARTKAMGEIEAVAADAASEMVLRVAGTAVTPEAALQAVKAAING